jgi:hypothetical protein
MASHLEALRADLAAKVAASAAGKRRNLYTPGEKGYRQFWYDYCTTSADGAPASIRGHRQRV